MELLSDAELIRYNRQISLQGFDFSGQERLKQATVLIVGLGGLGCAAAQYLTAAGVGQLLLVDFDRVSYSNLQRQILYLEKDVGHLKVLSAQERLLELNPHTKIEVYPVQLSDTELFNLVKQVDLILDCTDNIDTREQLNRIGFTSNTPLISGSAIRMEGQIAFFRYQEDEACYHCLSRFISRISPSCAESGVLSPLVGIVGNIQALEAIKYLTQYGEPLHNQLLLIDAMTLEFHRMKITKDQNCPVCTVK